MGPLVTFERCQLVIGEHQRAMVRPSLLTSGGQDSSRVVVGELEGVSERDGGPVDLVDASYGFLGVPGGADFSVGVTGVEEATEAGSAPVADTFGSGCQ